MTVTYDGLIGSTELIRRAGISLRQIDYWNRIKLIEPTIPARGSGTQILWQPDEAIVAACIAALRATGIRNVSREVACAIRAAITDGRRLVLPTDPNGIVELELDVDSASELITRRLEQP